MNVKKLFYRKCEIQKCRGNPVFLEFPLDYSLVKICQGSYLYNKDSP